MTALSLRRTGGCALSTKIAAATALLLHEAILVLPPLAFGGWRVLLDPAVILFFIAAGLLFVADLPALKHERAGDETGGSRSRAVPRSETQEGARARAPCHAVEQAPFRRRCSPAAADSRPPSGWAPVAAEASAARETHTSLLCGVVLLLLFWTALIERSVEGATNLGLATMAGALLMFCGATLRFAAIQTLGPFFRSEPGVRRNQRLVRTGVYSSLRHPSELGNLLVSLGAVICLQSTVAGLMWLGVLLPIVLARVRQEDRQLSSVFGSDFRRYTKEVGGLLPAPQRLRRGKRIGTSFSAD